VTQGRPTPFDVVLAVDPAAAGVRRGRVLLAAALALALHAGVIALALRSGPSLETWSARLALSVHEALLEARPVDLDATQPVEPAPAQAEAPEPPPLKVARAEARPARAPAPQPSAAAAPAIAVAQGGPVDLTASAIVTGTALVSNAGYSSAAGSGNGRGKATGPSAPSDVGARDAARAVLSRGVTLDPTNWRCAWPREAIAQDVFERSVVLRVLVRPDGSAESAQLLSEPGFGLGRAALGCARTTRFTPALDREGRPVRATSPPIRVRFTR
jgi:protein TonB